MIALLIEVDFSTGRRAGGINPRDKHLLCHGWQNLDSGLEIRIIEDGRKIEQYQGVKGITILEGKEAINAAIEENIPTQYAIKSETLLLEHMKEKKLSIDILVGKTPKEMAEEADKQGLAGVVKRKPKLLE